MSSDGKDLGVILAAKEKRENRPDVSSQVISEMKSSLLFQINWEELLQCAPTAISSMGACFLASSSDKAVVTLTPPEKGFQYLRYTSVQANLVECGNLGRYAFLEAENGMGTIQMTSQVINGKINDIVATLGDPVSAKKLLRPQLDTLKNGANTCYEKAKAMDLKFTEWLLYVCEMHAACVQQENDTRSALLSNQISMTAEQSRLDYQKSTVEEAKKASDLMGKQVDMASKAFNKASDEFPTGWDLMGQQIVGDLAGCVTTALNAAIPALVNNLNPMAKVSAGADIVGGFINPKKNGETNGTANGTASTPSNAAATSAAIPKQTADPAYPEAIKINTYLSMMQVIVSGKKADGGIDWDMARGSSDGGKSSMKFVVSMLGDAKDRFSAVATSAEPSVTLNSIFDTSLTIARAIEDTINKSGAVTSSFPAKDSEQVKKWQSDFTTAYGKANTLKATANSIPGGSANGVPLMAQDPAVQTAQINAKTAQAQAVLESAKNRLTTTQQMLTTSQENYVKTTDMLLQQQNKLAEIQSTLIKLTASNVQLDEIKKILIECIKLIINLKQQITNLVRFFKAIASIVEMCIQYHVTPFIETIKALVAADGTDPNQNLKIGDFTLTDLQRSQVYAATVTLRSYFSVFGDIAKMWVTLSKENVLPGLKMCDDLSITTDSRDPGAMKKKLDTLNKWSTDASNRVNEIAKQKQREIMDGMDERIANIGDTTKMIAAPPAETIKAITAGTNVNKDAAQDSIKMRSTGSALSRFAIIDD